MTEVNFSELLSAQVDTVERPKNFPAGPYSAIVVSHEQGTSSQKGTPFVRFLIKLISPLEGVPMDEFEEAGGMEALNARKPLRVEFYLTKEALYRLREFLESSLELSCDGRTFDEVIPESTNAALTVTIKLNPGSKPGDIFMNIDDHAKAA